MRAFAEKLAHSVRPGDVLAFFGHLGAGKTTCIQHLIYALNGTPTREILSPTFNYYNTYGTIHHFDLYRLKNSHEFYALGFEELLHSSSICCIEWAERIEDLLPKNATKIYITQEGAMRICEVFKRDLSQISS